MQYVDFKTLLKWPKIDIRNFDYKRLDPRKVDFRKFDVRKTGTRKSIETSIRNKIDGQMISTVLTCVITLFVFLFVLKAGGLLYTVIFTKSAVARAVERSKPTPEAVASRFAALKKHAGQIKAKNFFNPAGPPMPPVCTGILGDKALLGGKWYGVGESSNDATIKNISAADVTVEWMGKEVKLSPITAPITQVPQMPGMAGMPPSMMGQVPPGQSQAGMAAPQQPGMGQMPQGGSMRVGGMRSGRTRSNR